jgi:hypothetical protein
LACTAWNMGCARCAASREYSPNEVWHCGVFTAGPSLNVPLDIEKHPFATRPRNPSINANASGFVARKFDNPASLYASNPSCTGLYTKNTRIPASIRNTRIITGTKSASNSIVGTPENYSVTSKTGVFKFLGWKDSAGSGGAGLLYTTFLYRNSTGFSTKLRSWKWAIYSSIIASTDP